jgi:hypothetical protein
MRKYMGKDYLPSGDKRGEIIVPDESSEKRQSLAFHDKIASMKRQLTVQEESLKAPALDTQKSVPISNFQKVKGNLCT